MSDLIDRQAAIEATDTILVNIEAIMREHAPEITKALHIGQSVKTVIKQVPSARKTGKWIPFEEPWYQCSECGAVREQKSFMENYCPNCGTDMRGEE